MNIDLEPETYVLAVSGGVDSMVLLDLVVNQFKGTKGFRFVIAHFDHGIRGDSALDRRAVQTAAKNYGLPFVYENGLLGVDSSEALARQARYKFLHSVRSASGAEAVITAHHRDDVLETAILQLIRGTGRRGLSSLGSTERIKRPLINVPKNEITKYALENGVTWREDSTNSDQRFLRNHIRHSVIPRLNGDQKQYLNRLIDRMREVNRQIDEQLDLHLHLQPGIDEVDRAWFISLPHNVSIELMAHWLRRHGFRDFDKRLLEKLVVSAKTFQVGRRVDVNKEYILKINAKTLALKSIER